LAVAIALQAALGCGTSERRIAVVRAQPTTGEASTQPQGGAAPSAEQGKVHPDAATALLQSADQPSLSGPQRATVHALRQQLYDGWQGIDAAVRAMRAHLAAQVRTGALDPAQVQADESLVVNALEKYRGREIFALNGLHAVLRPEQRVAVAARVRAERPGRAEAQARPEPEGTAARLDRMTRDLALDAEQQQRVAGLLAEQPAAGPRHPAEFRGMVDTVLNAFPASTFDASSVLPAAPSPVAMVHEHVQRHVAFLAQLLPLLRPDQREKLASSIEKGDTEASSCGG
jgi:hypothetical protein